MAHPKNPAPRVATDATWATGPDIGQPTRVAVSAGEQAQGMIGGDEYPAAKFNYLLGVMSDHVANVAELALRTWDRVPTDTLGAADDDRFYNIFAHSRGSERAGRLYILGTDSAQTSLRTWWNPHVNIWHGTSHAGTGQLLEMAVNADGSVLVAVGTGMGNKVQRSTDGTSFAEVATHMAADYRSVCYSNGAFYAIQSGSTTPKIGKSADGSVWTAAAAQPFTFHTPGLCRAGKVGGVDAVLVQASLNTYVSTDGGATWTGPGTLPVSGTVDIQFSEALGMWMAVSSLMSVSVSPDGVNWTQVRTPSITSGSFSGIQKLACDGGGAWVVSGNIMASPETPGPVLAYSVDLGVTWTGVRLDESSSFCAVCWHPVEQRFYAMCDATSGTRPALVFRTPSYGVGGGLII